MFYTLYALTPTTPLDAKYEQFRKNRQKNA